MCLVSSLWFSCGRAVSAGEAAKNSSPFRRFPSRLSCRFAWQSRHFATFRRVLYRVESRFVIFVGQSRYSCDVFARWEQLKGCAEKKVTVSWAGAELWRPLSSLCVAGSALQTIAHSTLRTLHSTLHPLHFTLHTLHSTLYTPHSTLYTPHSTLTLYTQYFTLYTLHFTPRTLHFNFTLHTPHSIFHTLHQYFTLYCTLLTPHSGLYTLHFTLHTPHFTLHTPHSTHLSTPHSTLHTLHFSLRTSHFTLYTLHITLYILARLWCFPIYAFRNPYHYHKCEHSCSWAASCVSCVKTRGMWNVLGHVGTLHWRVLKGSFSANMEISPSKWRCS